MHPWFSWLRWINPVQYGFEALLANEFSTLDINCTPPYLVPQLPGIAVQNQGCTVQGSTPGSTIVKGSNYIETAYSYSRSHLWRNFGFICAFFGFFVFLTALGMELQKPNKGGGAVTIYKRGQVPSAIEKSIEKGTIPTDEETGTANSGKSLPLSDQDSHSGKQEKADPAKKVAGNESVFTWQGVNYSIPYQGKERKLLQDVQGYVKPGKLTALMVSSASFCILNRLTNSSGCFRSW
jgi:ATP-binding cassette, subfamily G (WHITE), member 2, PDR